MVIDKKLIIVIILAIAAIAFVTIVPAMLSATNDIAVISGVLIVIIAIYAAIRYAKSIIEILSDETTPKKEEKNEKTEMD